MNGWMDELGGWMGGGNMFTITLLPAPPLRSESVKTAAGGYTSGVETLKPPPPTHSFHLQQRAQSTATGRWE